MPGKFDTVKLYVLLTEALCHGDWYETAEAALAGGAGAIQLREKQLTDIELLDRARRIRELCERHEALLIINDRPDIALAVGAHGVHLGQEDASVSEARRILGDECIIGVSTHTVEQAKAAVAGLPDYIAVGPMFESHTKPQDHIAGPETLSAVRSLTSLPLVAIGGITLENAAQCAPADVLAVCSAVISVDDVASATRELMETSFSTEYE
ncbi:MAG: thiamine phosphate synthase [Planctomycetes bacterium]|nr:thiamine phosphate synthase [Planctomycetota bacterium]